jgi:hypothetical protein
VNVTRLERRLDVLDGEELEAVVGPLFDHLDRERRGPGVGLSQDAEDVLDAGEQTVTGAVEGVALVVDERDAGGRVALDDDGLDDEVGQVERLVLVAVDGRAVGDHGEDGLARLEVGTLDGRVAREPDRADVDSGVDALDVGAGGVVGDAHVFTTFRCGIVPIVVDGRCGPRSHRLGSSSLVLDSLVDHSNPPTLSEPIGTDYPAPSGIHRALARSLHTAPECPTY